MKLDILEIETLVNTYLIPWGINIAIAIVIFIVGLLLASIINRIVKLQETC